MENYAKYTYNSCFFSNPWYVGLNAYETFSFGVSPRRWGSQNPPETSEVVLGENLSAMTMTSAIGCDSIIRKAEDRPITPAPTTHILTIFPSQPEISDDFHSICGPLHIKKFMHCLLCCVVFLCRVVFCNVRNGNAILTETNRITPVQKNMNYGPILWQRFLC